MSEHKNTSEQHRQTAEDQIQTVKLGLVTVSDTRTVETDVNGSYLHEQITAAGHEIVFQTIVKDEADEVENALDRALKSGARIILFNGGTGISPRDRTYDVLSRKLEKPLQGFGELFRMLSYDQVGSAAMLSRATAGVYSNRVVISTPGSPAAVRLAWEKLIAPELHHLAWELIR